MTSKKNILLMAAAALLVAGGVAVMCIVYFTRGPKAPEPVKDRPAATSRKTVVLKRGTQKQRVRQNATAIKKEKPTLKAASEDEQVKLSDAYKALLAEIKAALDADDRDALVKIVRRMQSSEEWPDGIPSILHKAAIDAMEWFGTSTAPELVGYLASADGDVIEAALEAMEDMVADVSIGDSERSSLLLNYTKVVRDADTLDTMMMELDNMRPTIRAQTAMAILEGGNQTAISVLKEGLEDFFDDIDDVDVLSAEDLPTYLKEAERIYKEDPDQAKDDEEMYGPDKDDDDD